VILIVSPPGNLQIGLQALLTTHLDVDVLVVGNAASALKVIEKYHPALIIIDQDIPGETSISVVKNVKTMWPDIQCLVLANDDQGRQKLSEVGADLVVIKGLPGAKLVAEINSLLEFGERNS